MLKGIVFITVGALAICIAVGVIGGLLRGDVGMIKALLGFGCIAICFFVGKAILGG